MDWQFDQDNPLTRGFEHLHIPVDDVEDENLIRWFPQSNAFIDKGLKGKAPQNQSTSAESSALNDDLHPGNGIFIHCAMGKSRSATVLLAYLLWSSRQPRAAAATSADDDVVSLPSNPLTVEEALMLLRKGRPIAEPNEGFMDQLYMYVDMGCPTTSEELESHKLYRRFMNRRNVAESLAINRAPDVDDIRFEDDNDDVDSLPHLVSKVQVSAQPAEERPKEEVVPGVYAPTGAESPSTTSVQVRCRRCRQVLASTPHIVSHTPSRSDPASQACAHIFLHPLSWMRQSLAQGELEGRLSCPNKKCGINVGKFAWQGLRCSCGGWVTPGFGVLRGKVDEATERPGGHQRTHVAGLPPGGSAIRLPPGMKGRGGGNL